MLALVCYMEVTQGVDCVCLTPLSSGDHLERKQRETKAYHIRETTVSTQGFGGLQLWQSLFQVAKSVT